MKILDWVKIRISFVVGKETCKDYVFGIDTYKSICVSRQALNRLLLLSALMDNLISFLISSHSN